MSSSELSSPLSSLASDDGEIPPFMLDGAADARPKADSSDELSSPAPSIASSAPKRKRPESPPHEEVLADNQDIAVRIWRVHHVPNACLTLSRIFSLEPPD